MIEFRWIVILSLWTLLIGPVLDFYQQRGSTSSQAGAKTTMVKSRAAR